MTTFIDLYKTLQCIEEKDFNQWLHANDNIGTCYKQEALIILFGSLSIISKLKEYIPCHGSFNENTLKKQECYNELFIEDGNERNIKGNGGDSSDFTMISKSDDKKLLVISSKCLTTEGSGKLDIEKMAFYGQKYVVMGYTIIYGFAVSNKTNTDDMMNRTHKSSKDLADIYNRKDTIVIDWNDLSQAFHVFKMYFQDTTIDSIINSTQTALSMELHQELTVIRTMRLKNCNEKEILWGHIQRSGKSYIIAGCIIEDSKNKDKCNYLVITTAPKETTKQQKNVFNCLQLDGFNIVSLDGKNKTPTMTDKNIILCSKQFLQTKIEKGRDKQKHIEIKTNNITWLKNMKFDMRFIDESHNGGTTELAKKTLKYYGNTSFTVQITATYSKPINHFNIPKENWILWDLEDIKLCKTINHDESINRLIEKHGEDIINIINKYSTANIIHEYSKYPELYILTRKLTNETTHEIINETSDNNYGWSTDGCFLLKQCVQNDIDTNAIQKSDEFQNESENLKLWYNIFGKKSKFGIPDKEFPDETVFMKRIEKICKNPDINSRFIGEGKMANEPMIIITFLPQNNIDKISNATIELLLRNNVIPDYEIISINSKTTDNPKQTIENARNKARNSGKKGVLVLSGKQCSLGVTIDNCDIVLLLNNNISFDMIYQMMFRCMTYGEGKKCGFVIDLNIHRVIQTSIIDYAFLIQPNSHPREAIKYILNERLINLNGDHWMPSFGNDINKVSIISENIYNIYASKSETALKQLLDRLRDKDFIPSNEKKIIHNALKYIKLSNKRTIEPVVEDENIQPGIEKIKVESFENTNSEAGSDCSDSAEEIETNEINYTDIIIHIIPLVCIFTIRHNETSFGKMFYIIENDEYLMNILLNQIISWWGNNIDAKTIQTIMNIYIYHMKDDKETTQIIRTIKELFMKNITNRKELSNLIDTYFIPQEMEKQRLAEVSTHFKLRNEMLDTMPLDFWKSIKKVIEPCCGKGGFLIDIIDRFMLGLIDIIPDEKERYKTIVEKCLYFCDINATNIFICKLLVDPNNEYNLNYYEGNTLELDVKNKWGFDTFDATIGNPPYNEDPANSDDPHKKPLYQHWIYKFTKLSPILLFITPSKWFTSQDTLLVELRNYMKKCNIEFIKHYPNDDVFKTVKIKGGVSYYIINKFYEGKPTFNGIEIDITKYDIILEPKYYKLIETLDSNNHFNRNLEEIYCSQGTFLNSKTEKELTHESKDNILCYVSKQKGLTKYISKDKITKNYNYPKIATPAAAYKGSSGFADIYKLSENEIHSRSYISFKVATEPESDSLYSYLKCKLPHVLLSTRKITHNLCNSTVFKWIPFIPLDRLWDDKQLYEYFKFDEELINIINEIEIEGSYTKL